MAELYKCIGCGAEKIGDRVSTCTECGFKMFPYPYDRRQVLTNELKVFLRGYEISDIENNDLNYKGKASDDGRFPNFDTIQNYVTSSKKAEQFFDRLRESIDNIEKHIQTPFDKAYEVDVLALKERIAKADEILCGFLKELNISETFPDTEFPKIKADYQEIPDDELLPEIEALLGKISVLCDKLERFVKVNNVYGDSFKAKAENKTIKAILEPAEILESETINIEKICKKNYVIDIFSDGSEEAKEMAKAIWRAVRAIMDLPYYKKHFTYYLEDGSVYRDDEIKKKLSDIVSKRYDSINSLVSDDSYFDQYSEESLFELYYKAITSDKNHVLKANSYNLINVGESEKRLNGLIGLNSIKDSIIKIKTYASRNKNDKDLHLHMVFYGNPGTGKTEVARIIAGILYENKILPSNKVIETDRSGMIGQYVGETPQKVMNLVDRAMGGVLFIDEAYALISDSRTGRFDYGHEAIATLIKAMEDYRGKFCVILAGYRNQMQEMLKSNPGFMSRIQFSLDFPNYSRDDLEKIGKLMLEKRGYSIADNALKKILDITDIKRKEENFANAREIRNIIDQVIMCQNLRVSSLDDKQIGITDVNRYILDAKINLPLDEEDGKRILSADEELDRLVGLESVKKTMKKVKAYAKRNKNDPDFNLHMRFNGNPGTGKTEVARILSRILYEAGVLKEAKLVETDAYGLLGSTVGETAPKTRAKIEDALDGVLFIDEAYALCENRNGSMNYGAEAVAVLLKEMEDKRGCFCTILAGYKDEMNRMIASNPGFESRIQFSIDFPDYTREELGQIAKKMLHKKGYRIDEDALSRILDITDHDRQKPNYANARNVRNILDQVILNQNLRTEDEEEQSDLIILQDVEEFIEEKGLNISNEANRSKSALIDLNELIDEYQNINDEIDNGYISQAVISLSGTKSQGTGFLISKDGICLTCDHCIDDKDSNQQVKVSVTLANGRMMTVQSAFEIMGRDKENDIAVIKLTEDMGCPYLPLAEKGYRYLPLNEFITAGYPFGKDSFDNLSFSEGKIASVNEIDGRKVVFADMFGKPGSSGSPIIEKENKKVIGIYWGGILEPAAEGILHCFTPVDKIWELLSRI